MNNIKFDYIALYAECARLVTGKMTILPFFFQNTELITTNIFVVYIHRAYILFKYWKSKNNIFLILALTLLYLNNNIQSVFSKHYNTAV